MGNSHRPQGRGSVPPRWAKSVSTPISVGSGIPSHYVGADLCVRPCLGPGKERVRAGTAVGSDAAMGDSTQIQRTGGDGAPPLPVKRRADVPKAWPLQDERKAPLTALASGAERSVCAAVGRSGWGSRQRSSPKFPSTSDDPSVAAFGRDSSLCAREPLALRGGGRTHRSAPTRSSECTATPGGAGQSPPPTGRLEPISGGGVWSPRPTEAMLAVRSSGPMQASAPTERREIRRRFAPRNSSSPSPARSEAPAPVPGKVQEGAESPFLVSASGGKKQNHFSSRRVRDEKSFSRSDV